MGSITLTAVTLTGTPVVNQLVNIKIRLTADPDVPGSYTDKGFFSVLPNGNFVAPVVITGLTDATPYTLWITSQCSNSSFTHNYTTLARLNYTVIEPSNPYSDVNLQIKVNGVIKVDAVASTSGTIYMPVGASVTCEAQGLQPSTGSNPELHLNAKKNTVTFFDDTEPNNPPPTTDILTAFTVTTASVYDILAEATADNPTTTPCGSTATYSGGAAFPSEVFIDLGSGTGNVVLHYDALSIPDKFEVFFGGNKVIDTGYRGDSSYQSALDAALAAMSLPPETIMGTGSGTASFTKSSVATFALVRVYAPLSGTAWNFIMDCPV